MDEYKPSDFRLYKSAIIYWRDWLLFTHLLLIRNQQMTIGKPQGSLWIHSRTFLVLEKKPNPPTSSPPPPKMAYCPTCNSTRIVLARCSWCGGQGGADIQITCPGCNGNRQVQNYDGAMSECGQCRGRGLTPYFVRCVYCNQGWVRVRCPRC